MEKLLLVTVFLFGGAKDVPQPIKTEKVINVVQYDRCTNEQIIQLIEQGKTDDIAIGAWQEYKKRGFDLKIINGMTQWCYFSAHAKTESIVKEAWEKCKIEEGIDWGYFAKYGGSDAIANEAWRKFTEKGGYDFKTFMKYGKNEAIKNDAWERYKKEIGDDAKIYWDGFIQNGETDFIANDAWEHYKANEKEPNYEYYLNAGKTEYIRNDCKNHIYDISNFIKK